MVFRSFYEVARGFARRSKTLPGEGITSPHIWRTRAGLLDIDVYGHVNNASVPYNAELARWELSAANGLLSAVLNNKWLLIVAGQSVRYRREIPYRKHFNVITKVSAMDPGEKGKWVYLDHVFESLDGKTRFAHVTVRATVLSRKDGIISPMKAFSMSGVPKDLLEGLPAPEDVPMTAAFAQWDDAADVDAKEALLKLSTEINKE